MSVLTKLQNADGRKIKWVIFGIIMAFLAITWFGYSSTMTYSASDTALTISYRGALYIKTTHVINYADIERVDLFQSAPPMRRTFGANMGAIRVGTFASDDLGSFKAVINDISRPLLFIKAKDQAYMISPDDAASLQHTIRAKLAK